MDALSISETDKSYELVRRAEVKLHHVSAPQVEAFASALYDFIRDFDGVYNSDEWSPVIRKLKSYFFNLRAAPVPGNLDAAIPGDTLDLLDKQVDQIETTYPELKDRAWALLEATYKLRLSDENPLLDALLPFLTGDVERKAVLLKSSRLVPDVKRIIDVGGSENTVSVITLSDRSRSKLFDTLLIPGRPIWFSRTDIFHAPYADETHVFLFDWYEDSIDIEPALSASKTGQFPEVTVAEPSRGTTSSHIDPEELEPVSSWDDIIRSIIQSGDEVAGSREKHEEANAYLLEGGYVALLPTDPSHTVLTLQLEDGNATTNRVKVGDLNKGDFILLRTEGGGDMIDEVANKILGDKAQIANEHKIKWKSRLEDYVNQEGAKRISKKLERLGAPTASPPNVRNWCSSSRIKPAKHEDFESILELVGLASESDEYWKYMKMIESAHRRAGHRIRSKILNEVSKVDPEDIYEAGCYDLELDQDDGGTITAFRIGEISQKSNLVPSHKLNTPFPKEL